LKGCCPFHSEKTPSFYVYSDHFHCFGCQAHGDQIAFMMRIEGISFIEAFNRLAAAAGMDAKAGSPNGAHADDEWQPTVPPPAGAPKPSDNQLRCDMLHEYIGADDQPLCYVRRFEARAAKGKSFLPLTFGTLKGKLGWHDKAPGAPKPLYRLNALSHAAADATVLLCEGEKKADAAQRMFPDYVCMSWMGGANADGRADLSPLKGHPVVIWPDADKVGVDAAARLAKRLPGAGILDTQGLPDGFDAADLERLDTDPQDWLTSRLPQHHRGAPDADFGCTLAALEQEEFSPIKWVVPEFIPEGLTVFAGRPKIGKSWLILNVALGVARGTEALGKFIERGDVLYCGLEDGRRRMRSRVAKILGPAIKGWPANFTFRHRLDPLDAGGLETIEEWLTANPNHRLVVIDTLGRVRGMKNVREEQYQYDYRLIGGLQELATRYGVAIVIVHHVRKSDAEDVLDTVSGTTGIAGAADTVVVLGRTAQGVRLYLRGRDVEEQDKLVEFDPETAIWSVTSDYDEAVPDSPTQGMRRTVFDLLDASPMPLTPAQVAQRLGKDSNKVRFVLYRMLRADPPQVVKDSTGAYAPVRARARAQTGATGATGENHQ
jgi:hypothetical protein